VAVADARVGLVVVRVPRAHLESWKDVLYKVKSFQAGKLLTIEVLHVAGSVAQVKRALSKLFVGTRAVEQFRVLALGEWQALADSVA
jgi:hypothetical protein